MTMWGRYCKNNAGKGVQFVTPMFDPFKWDEKQISDHWTPDFFMWYDTENPSIWGADMRTACTFASRNVKGLALGTDLANNATATYCTGETVEECWDPANPQTCVCRNCVVALYHTEALL